MWNEYLLKILNFEFVNFCWNDDAIDRKDIKKRNNVYISTYSRWEHCQWIKWTDVFPWMV